MPQEETWNYVDMTEINKSEQESDKFFEEFNSYGRTKIGGYAAYIQSPCSERYDYVFQIASEEKPRFGIGDNGNLYIMRATEGDHWYLHWDCY
jgi:hypothetical protein